MDCRVYIPLFLLVSVVLYRPLLAECQIEGAQMRCTQEICPMSDIRVQNNSCLSTITPTKFRIQLCI